MPVCEMCGKEAVLVLAEIEGVSLKVCSPCARYGTVKSAPPGFGGRKSGRLGADFRSAQSGSASLQKGPEEKVANNYARLIHEAREKKGMTQEDFSKFLNEKESLVAKWESGSFPPNLAAAKRLQRLLGIRLVVLEDGVGEDSGEKKRPVGDVLTLGDFIKVKKRK